MKIHLSIANLSDPPIHAAGRRADFGTLSRLRFTPAPRRRPPDTKQSPPRAGTSTSVPTRPGGAPAPHPRRSLSSPRRRTRPPRHLRRRAARRAAAGGCAHATASRPCAAARTVARTAVGTPRRSPAGAAAVHAARRSQAPRVPRARLRRRRARSRARSRRSPMARGIGRRRTRRAVLR